MKCIVLFVFCAAATFAADFNTGQAARALVGQPQFTRQDASPTESIIGGASGVVNGSSISLPKRKNKWDYGAPGGADERKYWSNAC